MTAFSLKLVALICMFCDHLSKVVLSTGCLISYVGVEGNLWIRTVLCVVGRIAFPIFSWFTAEGCRKTSNPGRYLLRLTLFAVLAEVPFQLCFYGGHLSRVTLGGHNVIFTMLFGAGGILLGQRLMERGIPKWFSLLLPACLAVWLGFYLSTDYNGWGVALIILLYHLKEERQQLIFLTCWITVFMLIWHGWNGEVLVWLSGKSNSVLLLEWIGALFSVGFLLSYNGEKGRGSKWLFYLFYPIHLMLLYLIRCILVF